MAVLTPETFANIERDADDIGKTPNIDALIVPRYGAPYKSFPMVSREGEEYFLEAAQLVIQSGLLEGFNTEAELLASRPSVPKKYAKANDTKVVWFWNRPEGAPDGNYWVSTGLSELDQAKEIISQRVDVISDAIHTHILIDLNKNRMFAVQKDGGLKAVGLNGTIQEEILNALSSANKANNNIEQRATISSDAIHTHIFSDVSKQKMFAIQKDGGLVITGFDGTLQDILNDLYKVTSAGQVTGDTSIAMLRTKRDIFTDDSQQVLDMQRYASIIGAPAPIDLHKRIYTINESWLDAIKFSKPANKTIVKTPYRPDDGVVHPHVIEFYNGFRGYRYLIKLEPYYNTQEAFENPCVYGSNDLVTLDLLDGFQQPLAERPISEFGQNHNSDGVFTYDPRTGDLILVWRETWRNYQNTDNTYDALAMRKTKDGYLWTDKEYLLEPRAVGTGFNTAAPGILYDPIKDEWHIYVGTGNSVQHYVKKELSKENWQLPETIITPSGFAPWHLDVRFVGNKIVMLVHDLTNGQFRFGVSSDFVNFTWANESNYTESGTDMYKATFLPKINSSNQLGFIVMWTSRQENVDINKRWNLFINQTNYVDAGVEFI